MVIATVINPNLQNCKLSYRKGSWNPGLYRHSLFKSLWVFSALLVMGARCCWIYTHPTVQRYTRQVYRLQASKHNPHIQVNEFLGAEKEHTFAGTASLDRAGLWRNSCLEGRMEGRGQDKPSPGGNAQWWAGGWSDTVPPTSRPS